MRGHFGRVLPVFLGAFLLAACAGTSTLEGGGSVHLSPEDVAGIWEAGPRDLISGCPGEEELGTGEGYLLIVAVDDSHISIDLCEDSECNDREEYPQVFLFEGDHIVYAASGTYKVFDWVSDGFDCTIWEEIFRYNTLFTSATEAVHRQHYRLFAEGTECEKVLWKDWQNCETEFEQELWKIGEL